MPNLSREQLQQVKSTVERARAQMSRAREKTEEVVGEAIRAAETGAAAFGLGWVRGRFGEVSVLGVPVDVGAAAVLHGVAFLGGAGKYREHVHALGNGALAVYLTTVGAKVGDDMRKKAGGSTTLPLPPIVSNTSGYLPGYAAPGQSSGWADNATYQAAMAAAGQNGLALGVEP